MPNLNDLVNPYLTYIKIAAVVMVIAIITGSCLYVRSVFKERETLLGEKVLLTKQLKNVQDSMEANLKLQEGIQNAIKNIKVVSNNYIDTVDNTTVAPLPDGSRVVLVSGGLPKAVPGLFKPYSANRASPNP